MKKSHSFWKKLAVLLVVFWAQPQAFGSVAGLKPERVSVADSEKTKSYVKDGIIVGGDSAINDVIVKSIRHSRADGYERIVIDLEGNRDGKPVVLERAPFFQVAVMPEMKRYEFTIMGNPKLNFSLAEMKKSFSEAKGSVIDDVELMPIIEDDRWMFVIYLKDDRQLEVFELSFPTLRIVADIKSDNSSKRQILH